MSLITDDQIAQFHQDGLLLLDRIIDSHKVLALRESFARIFNGEFETGTLPDEVNWQQGKSDPTLTRQICNAWKADLCIASVILNADLGQVVAGLMGWQGTRVMQDNALWKPAGARSLGFHQDNAYLDWFSPGEVCSVWIALDDVKAEHGTMELVRGSQCWGESTPTGEFHAPEDYRAPMLARAQALNAPVDIVPVAVASGGGSIHHGWTWHGSGPNSGSTDRRALVLHAMPSEVAYRREGFARGTGPIYSRYARLDSDHMDENYFPITWREDGYRSAGIERYLRESLV